MLVIHKVNEPIVRLKKETYCKIKHPGESLLFAQRVSMDMMKQKLLLIFLAANVYTTGVFASDTIYPLITYSCDPKTDTITLTNSLLKNNEGASYKYSDEDGTYSPWNLVEIDRRTEHTRIVKTKKINKTCKLSSGKYNITIEPQVFSKNMDRSCGTSISAAFTVTFDGFDIKERTPFEDYCHGNSLIITQVTVFGKTSEIKIKRTPRYKFY
ncbi:hypothetical protein MNBD_GAMMA06-84 [hydrothermal vent metagenome]|uniref:Uncharacterized protein n=1 Tax=hydrothermal vent metagenome TaxID=652676 RepID=A0A3B0W5I8_9ZZZZ